MLVPFLPKLAEEKPFHVERQNSVLREIDAPLLLVLNSLSRWADVAVNVQDRREFPLHPFRFIKNCDRLKPRDNFIPKLPQPITLARFDHSDVFKLWRGVDPRIGPTVKYHVLEQMLAKTLRLLRPLLSICGRRWRSDPAEDVRLHLIQSGTGC